jgi:deoxyhypusine synthase
MASSSCDAPKATEGNLGMAAAGLVLIGSEDLPAGTPVVRGHDFEKSCDLDSIMASFRTTGFQASNLALACDEINKMLAWRLSDDPVTPAESEEFLDPAVRAKTRGAVWLSFTSNMISCGVREVIRYIVKHKLVTAIVTTAGAIEEDLMKCLKTDGPEGGGHATHYMGDFELKGKELRMRGINRIGNLLVPNLSYVAFEDWFMPILNKMHDEQVRPCFARRWFLRTWHRTARTVRAERQGTQRW